MFKIILQHVWQLRDTDNSVFSLNKKKQKRRKYLGNCSEFCEKQDVIASDIYFSNLCSILRHRTAR